MKHIALFLIALVINSPLLIAQDMVKETLVGSNKMIAVIVVLAIILIGLGIFLFTLDKKIKRLEDEIKNK